jgi:predicted AAA+ superfamily ATPase
LWEPKPQDYDQVFQEQNPWQRTAEVPSAWSLPVERPLARFLWSNLLDQKIRRFELILGPRRVGKTTSMYQTVSRLIKKGVAPRRIWWLRLDHPLLMNIDLGSLVKSLLKSAHATTAEPAFVFLDELTYAKDWDLWLKTFYDDSWPLTLTGSSSSTAALRNSRMESGVGRWEEQYLAPYLFGEFLELFDVKVDLEAADTLAKTISSATRNLPPVPHLADLRRRFLLTGGFPELLIAAKNSHEDDASLLLDSQRTLRSDAVERAIYKDLPQAFGIDNPMLMERLLYTLAGQIGGIFSARKTSQSLPGLSEATIERYLTYLERAFLVFTIPNYSGNENARQRRGKKIYFVDGAVRNAALQRGLAPLNDLVEMGSLIENLAASHLHALGQLAQIRVYHWRHQNDEVDLIFDHPEFPMAFEIGSSPRHSTNGLRRLADLHPRFRGRSYLVAPEASNVPAESSADGIGSIGLDAFLLAVSQQAAAELRQRLGA